MKKLLTLFSLVAATTQVQGMTNIKDIKISCFGSYKVKELSNFQNYSTSFTARNNDLITHITYTADAKIEILHASQGCEILKNKYDIDFTKGAFTKAEVSSPFAKDLGKTFLHKKNTFNFSHNIYYTNTNGELPLYPEMTSEYISIKTGKAHGNIKFDFSDTIFSNTNGPSHGVQVNTAKLYGSIEPKKIADKQKLLLIIQDKIEETEDFVKKPYLQIPFFAALGELKPNSYHDQAVIHSSPALKLALQVYLKSVLDVVSLATQHTVSLDANDPVVKGLSILNQLLNSDLKFANLKDDQLVIDIFEEVPFIIDSSLHTQYSDKLYLNSALIHKLALFTSDYLQDGGVKLKEGQYLSAFSNLLHKSKNYMQADTKKLVQSLFL